MNFRKTSLTFIIAFIMIFSSATSYASSTVVKEESATKIEILPDTVSISTDENGNYVKASPDSKHYLKAKYTENERVYELADGEKLLYVGDNTYQKVEMVEVDLSDKNAVKKFLDTYKLPQEVVDSIYKETERASVSKDAQMIEIAVPIVSENNSKVSSDTFYYTYNGHNMMEIATYYYNLTPPIKTVKSGSTTKSWAERATSFNLITLGYTSSKVSFITSGISLLDWWLNYIDDTTFSASTNDYIQQTQTYDKTERFIYADVGSGYQIGYTCQKIHIDNAFTREYWYNSNVGTYKDTLQTVNETEYSPNWYNSSYIALCSTSNPIVERFHTILGNITLNY